MLIHSKTPPTVPMRDTYKKPFFVGNTVAFNCSGEVKIGTIISIDNNSYVRSNRYAGGNGYYWWKHKFSIKIMQENNAVSVIKNIRSFVVI